MVRALDVKVLAGLEPISTFGPARLRELLDYCQVETVPEGNDPFRTRGLEGQSVYLVDGEIELVYLDGNRVVVNAQSEWAKHPLGKRQPDVVAARALRESQLLRVDDELLDRMVTLDQISRHDPQANIHAAPLQAAGDAQAQSNVRHLLRSRMFNAEQLRNGPLAHVPMANISALLQRFEVVVVWAGDVIIREGDDGDYYYLIDSGRAEVTRHVGGVEVSLAELKAGDVFGEEALISGAKRNATITMKTNGVLLRLGRQDFMALLQEPLLHRIGYEKAVQAVAEGAVWIDVRHPSEYRYDRLPGAMNLPLNDVRNAIDVLDRSKKYIAYCQSGRRSAAAAFILAQAGYDTQVLDGGLWSVPKSKQQ
ncbi:MAG: cyclic nucleotide-binding domain-containing protein [Gallionella sp.]|jgi:rhodanese-related sulfurtransferase|nr:cyclic nucleotide-binding domain-containing protein [Gallionella sp.]MCK9354859.1 cyclic nucleotide-binding domain-containing protein [Gallionella sp.]